MRWASDWIDSRLRIRSRYMRALWMAMAACSATSPARAMSCSE